MKRRSLFMIAAMCLLAAMLIACSAGKSTSTGKGPILIGLQAPITGAFAQPGQEAKQAVEIVADLINKKGGVLGRQIQIMVADDASNPKDSALAAQKLVSQKATSAIATFGSSVLLPAADIYESNKVPCVAYGATSVGLTMDKQRAYFFRTCGRDDAQGQAFAKFVQAKGFTKLAIMHDSTSFAKGVAAEAQKYLKADLDSGKVKLVYFDAITPGEKDFSPVISKLVKAKPDVWFYTGYFAEAALLLRQGRDAGLKCPFIGPDAIGTDDFIKIASIEYAKGSFYINSPNPSELNNEQAKEFLTAYQGKYGNIPSISSSPHAVDGLNALVWAIGKAGSTDSEAVAKALHTQMDGCVGVTGPIIFTEQGDRKDYPFNIYQLGADGKWALYSF